MLLSGNDSFFRIRQRGKLSQPPNLQGVFLILIKVIIFFRINNKIQIVFFVTDIADLISSNEVFGYGKILREIHDKSSKVKNCSKFGGMVEHCN